MDALPPAAVAALLDNGVDCVKLIGLDGTLRYINPSGIAMLDASSFADLAGRNWASLWPEVMGEVIAAAYSSAANGAPTRFRASRPDRQGLLRWWDITISAVIDDAGVHDGYLCVVRDVTDMQNAREALEIASDEMKHRLKNSYAIVSSLLVAFARGDAGHEAFARAMTDRLGALGTAQSLFLSNEASCEVSRLIPALLAPFDGPNCPVVLDEQSSAVVDQGIADAIALVLGELSVNSAKHGALGHGGHVHVGSSLDPHALLTVRWSERSHRPVTRHARDGGQGLKLMERIVRTRGGTITIAWQPDGLDVFLSFPHQKSDSPARAAA